MATPHPYFVRDFAGIGGVLKQRPEDFVVHEIPAYDASGDGEHVLVEIEKTGLSTMDAIDHIARRLKVPRRDIGYAGLKDTHAVTRQWLSIRGPAPEAVNDVATEKIKVLFADRHRNKLRVGHLKGNRFIVKVRGVDPMKVVTLPPVLRQLTTRGMPNYIGEQRFGRRNNNDVLGAALLASDVDEVLRLLLGRPEPRKDSADEAAAREAFDAGNVAEALEKWPRRDRDERAALVRLVDGKSPAAVVTAIDERVRGLWISAMQSRGFNATVARRIAAIDDLIDGDIAFKHENGACFAVESADAERPRAQRFEISATGPLIGPRMARPTAIAVIEERAALLDMGMSERAVAAIYDAPAADRGRNDDGPPGVRRPLRVQPAELAAESGIDEHGAYITVRFALPLGAYATTLMRELMRNEADGSK